MSSSTTNLNLVKPDGTEAADISVINSNMDVIDANVATKAETLTVTDFTSSVTFDVAAQDAGKMFRKVGNTVFISYRSEVTNINQKLLFQLPVGYRPAVSIVAPAIYMALAFGAVAIGTDGKCSIIQTSSSNINTNVLLSVAFTVA